MLRKFALMLTIACALAAPGLAQTTRRTTTTTALPATTTEATTQETTTTTTTTPARSRTRRATSAQAATTASTAGSAQVRAAFDKLLEGIRQADVEEVMGVYTSSPQLVVFNNNGTVTRGAADYRSTREQIYSKVSGVNLTVRDVRVQMLGTGGAVVTALWTQEQTANGAPESATGRMTVVFQRVGGEWKAVHTHTSPDAPDPSRVLPSERSVTSTEVVPGARPTTPPATTPATRPTTTTRPPTTSPTRP